MTNKLLREKKPANRYSTTIYQMALASVLTALAVIIGAIAHFKIFGGTVYLVGAAIFLFPLFLRIDMIILATTTSVVLTDLITGWVAFTWISIVAYNVAVIIIWLFKFLQLKASYLLGTIIGAVILSFIYYSLEMTVFPHAKALNDLFATLMQAALCTILIFVLYTPMKLLSHLII